MKRSAIALALTLACAFAVASVAVAAGDPGATSGAAAARAARLRLEPLGDSITYGQQSSTGNGYRGPLWNELTREGHPLDFVGSVRAGSMADPDNEGHPGWRIDQIAGIADSSLARYKPTVVMLMVGANDLIQNFQVSTAPDRLSALVDQIVADDPTATVLVANLLVSTNANIARAEPAYNMTIPTMVQSKQSDGKHVVFVDMGVVTAADLADGEHPTDGGYQKMAAAWSSAIKAAVARGWIA